MKKNLIGLGVICLVIIGVVLIYQNHEARVVQDCRTKFLMGSELDREALSDTCRKINNMPTHAQEQELIQQEKAKEVAFEQHQKFCQTLTLSPQDTQIYTNFKQIEHQSAEYLMANKDAIQKALTTFNDDFNGLWQRNKCFAPDAYDSSGTLVHLTDPNHSVISGTIGIDFNAAQKHIEQCQSIIITPQDFHGLDETVIGDVPTIFASPQNEHDWENYKNKRGLLRDANCDGDGHTGEFKLEQQRQEQLSAGSFDQMAAIMQQQKQPKRFVELEEQANLAMQNRQKAQMVMRKQEAIAEQKSEQARQAWIQACHNIVYSQGDKDTLIQDAPWSDPNNPQIIHYPDRDGPFPNWLASHRQAWAHYLKTKAQLKKYNCNGYGDLYYPSNH